MIKAITKDAFRLTKLCFILAISTFLAAGCGKDGRESQQSGVKERAVRLVSWGGRFQKDLMDRWIIPAARRCSISLEAESWNGDYGILTGRIRKGLNNWDLVHVEAHYVQNSLAETLFESFPGRSLPEIDAQLRNDRAVPVLEYGYVLAYRKDIIKPSKPLDWSDFFNNRLAGQRGVRDFPVGNIEIALASLGRKPRAVLYPSQLSRTEVEHQIEDALKQFDGIKAKISWWTTGDQLQRNLATGDTPIAAAWSGRVLSAHRDVCGDKPVDVCEIIGNPKTAFISTDWWIIPQGSAQKDRANELLQCLFNSKESVNGAKEFSRAQGYAAPIQTNYDDELVNYYLQLGSSSNIEGLGRLDEKFWGLNYEWIKVRWDLWRSQR